MKAETLRFSSVAATCFILLLTSVVFAQSTFDVTFENGEVKQVVYYDDPQNLSKWELKISPIALGEAGTDFFGIQLLPKYRITSRIALEGRFLSPYSKSTAGELATTFLDLGAIGHITFLRGERKKKMDVSVEYEGRGSQILAYKVKLPVKKEYALIGDFGVGYIRFMSGIGYDISNPEDIFDKTRYQGGPVTSLGLNLGTSLQMTRSLKIVSNGKSRSFVNIGTLSASLTYGLENDLVIYESTSSGYVESANETSKLSIQALGWRAGIDQTAGLKNTGMGILFGIEFGKLPMYSIADKESKSLFLLLKLGLSLGANPWK
jgi:hypothetical protein